MLGRYLRQCGALWESETLDWELIYEKGALWLGAIKLASQGPERVTLYLPPDPKPETVEKLLAVVERACAPLPEREIKKGLGTLFALCKTRAMDEDEISMSLELFTEKLAGYPADAVTYALKTWPEHNTFFPAWNELKRLVELHCWSRLRLRTRLRDILRKSRDRASTPAIEQVGSHEGGAT